MVRHAPYAVLGDIVLAYGKTVKTACGKRVAVARTVDRSKTDCPDCQRVIAADRAQASEWRRIAEDMLHTTGCPNCGQTFETIAEWNLHRQEMH